MKQSEETDKIFPAFIKAQSAMGGAVKDKNNPFFKTTYADLGSVIKAIKEAMTENGLGVTQQPCMGETKVFEQNGEIKMYCTVGVTTRVIHESGQWMEDTLLLPSLKVDPQAAGSAITYARRYALASVFNVPVADDDANAAVFVTKPDGLEGERTDLHRHLDNNDFYSAAELWLHTEQADRPKVFTKLPNDIKAKMQSEHFKKAVAEVQENAKGGEE